MNRNSLIKKCLVVAVVLLFIGMSVIPSTGTVVEKKSTMLPSFYDGNTLYVGGDGPGNYTRIQDAIDDASDGDMVYVYDDSSPYYENLKINKSINLIGENKDTTVIDGNRSIYVSVDWINISEFTIQCGIFLESCGNNIISDNIICRGFLDGIELVHSSNNIISDNIISNNSIGIIIISGNNNNITGNKISNCFFGITLFSSKNIIEKNNFIGNKRHAIFSDLWRNILIKNYWDSNYWDKWIGFGPKLIFGRMGIIPWVNFDWHPAREPYDIDLE